MISTKRLCRIGIMGAMCFALSLLTIKIGTVHLSFESLPVILSAILFGPIEGALVGGIGELLNQLLSYGLSATTVLWIIPTAARGLIIGAIVWLYKKEKVEMKMPHYIYTTCVAALITTGLNTLCIYLDSVIYGYYTYAYVMGNFFVRIMTGLGIAVIIGIILKPIVDRLNKETWIKEDN